MNEENKILNFTTSNAFLHYGVKGMQWGVITSEYEPVGRKYKNVTGVGKPIKKRGNGLNKTVVKNTNKANTKENQNDEQAALSAGASYLTNLLDSNGNINSSIFPENTSLFTNDPESQNYLDQIAKNDEAVDQINKFIDAFNAIADMDPKYRQRLFDKYKDKIKKSVDDYLTSLDYGEGIFKQAAIEAHPCCEIKSMDDWITFANTVFAYFSSDDGYLDLDNAGLNTGSKPAPPMSEEEQSYWNEYFDDQQEWNTHFEKQMNAHRKMEKQFSEFKKPGPEKEYEQKFEKNKKEYQETAKEWYDNLIYCVRGNDNQENIIKNSGIDKKLNFNSLKEYADFYNTYIKMNNKLNEMEIGLY